NSCNSASPFAPSSALNPLKPVKLPPGRLRLATSPSCAGSAAAVNTIGMLVVAALAARVDTSPDVTITATRSWTRSAANAGSRSAWFPAQRYSIAKFRPSPRVALIADNGDQLADVAQALRRDHAELG